MKSNNPPSSGETTGDIRSIPSKIIEGVFSVNWVHIGIVGVIPLIGVAGSFWVPLQIKTAIWTLFYTIVTTLGVTTGYHRLWAHRSYSATTSLRVILAALGTSTAQDTIVKWCRDHRAHHRYVDQEEDPYNIKKGFFHAHIGWLLFKRERSKIGWQDMSDLFDDAVVRWQRRYYAPLVVLTGFVLPAVVAELGWADGWGGLIYAGFLRIFVIQQGTFCTNSVAHYFGDQPFQSQNSPRNNFWFALVSFGEGYHNFHHEFPKDYRNGVYWYDFDPSKWAIWIWCQLGLASGLHRFPENEIRKTRLQQSQKCLEKDLDKIEWGTPLDELPILEWKECLERSEQGDKIMAIDGIVYEVSEFIKHHPGGEHILSGLGKDATAMFNGQIYNHSTAARNLLSTMRIARVKSQQTKTFDNEKRGGIRMPRRRS
ncbi:hypothetical protein FQN57_004549 [Myotisia sp. PD_48]|nr:hypothetical protein FQN57_004549 [Myotisia sp. PD_48]